MRAAVVGSRTLTAPNPGGYLPANVSEIIWGCRAWISARAYALAHDIKLTEYLPDYARHGRRAPLMRNDLTAAQKHTSKVCKRNTFYTPQWHSSVNFR